MVTSLQMFKYLNKKGFMIIHYDSKADLLYLRIEPETQDLINQRVTENIVLDIGKDDKIDCRYCDPGCLKVY